MRPTEMHNPRFREVLSLFVNSFPPLPCSFGVGSRSEMFPWRSSFAYLPSSCPQKIDRNRHGDAAFLPPLPFLSLSFFPQRRRQTRTRSLRHLSSPPLLPSSFPPFPLAQERVVRGSGAALFLLPLFSFFPPPFVNRWRCDGTREASRCTEKAAAMAFFFLLFQRELSSFSFSFQTIARVNVLDGKTARPSG